MKRARMREILLEEGFKVPEGMTDLKEYVYKAVNRCINEALASQVKSVYTFQWFADHDTLIIQGPRYLVKGKLCEIRESPFQLLSAMIIASMHGEDK